MRNIVRERFRYVYCGVTCIFPFLSASAKLLWTETQCWYVEVEPECMELTNCQALVRRPGA